MVANFFRVGTVTMSYFHVFSSNQVSNRSCFFQIEVDSPGWVAIALTFRGNVVGSDILVGWVAQDGTAMIVVSLHYCSIR